MKTVSSKASRLVTAICVFALLAGSGRIAVGASPYARWNWSAEIPEAYRTASPRAARTAVRVDALFHAASPTVRTILDAFGEPDGCSRQSMYSATKGSARLMERSFTLRFLLDDGGELHVEASDPAAVPAMAIRFDRARLGHLLYK